MKRWYADVNKLDDDLLILNNGLLVFNDGKYACVKLQGDPNKKSQNKKIVYSAKKELEVLDKVHLRGDVLVHVWCNLHREWLICACSAIICAEKSKNGFNAISENLHCQTLFCGKIEKKRNSNCM